MNDCRVQFGGAVWKCKKLQATKFLQYCEKHEIKEIGDRKFNNFLCWNSIQLYRLKHAHIVQLLRHQISTNLRNY